MQQIDDRQQKQTTCRIVDFAGPADHRVKLNESEKRDKYLDLARKQKKKLKANEKKDKYLDLARELKKTMKHESDVDAYQLESVRLV